MENELAIRIEGTELSGNLVIPSGASAIVIFAHGTGSSRHSPRNRFVAGTLQEAGFATLLFDLLTSSEEAADARTGHLRFDIDMLADRLVAVTEWLAEREDTRDLEIGYFGASTGAAAALKAAARLPGEVRAVVSRGGRPDLTGSELVEVRAPTRLIVGERDRQVIQMNREALAELSAEKDLQIVPNATHLFEEEGALEEAARLAVDWFERHLPHAS